LNLKYNTIKTSIHTIIIINPCINNASLYDISLLPYKNTFINKSDNVLTPEKDKNAGTTKINNDINAVTTVSPVI
jgi:hypothetical protein